MLQLFLNPSRCVLALKFGSAKLSRGEIQSRKPGPISDLRQRRQKVILLRTQRRIRRRARSHDPSYLPAHQFLGQPRVLHLLADRHLESFANELGDVAFRRMVGHPAHGNRNALFLVTRGQRNLQLARRQNCVVQEKLIEVAQPEEKQSAGMLFLDGGILPH